MRKKIMALDVGEKRIGVAFGDSEVKIAVPNGMIENNEETVAKLRKIVDDKKVDTIIVGLPRNSLGQETKQSDAVRVFSKKLRDFGVPIVFQDESFTSVEAKDIIESQQSVISREDRRKGIVDSKAAAIILTDYLEANFGR